MEDIKVLDIDPVEALRGLESMKNIFAIGEAATAILTTAQNLETVAIISGATPCFDVLKALNVLTGIQHSDAFSQLNQIAERLRQTMQIFPSRREAL